MAKGPADGYTLLAGHPRPLTVVPVITANMPYDTLRDFTPVILIAKSAIAMVVYPAVPAKNLKEFILNSSVGKIRKRRKTLYDKKLRIIFPTAPQFLFGILQAQGNR